MMNDSRRRRQVTKPRQADNLIERSYKNGDAPLRNSLASIEIPDKWDRSGLPAWTYFNKELLDLETEVLFRRHWQLACHQSDLPEPGSYVTFDMCGERAIIIRRSEKRRGGEGGGCKGRSAG